MADMQDLREEATCSVCLDYFKYPVTLDCGHNFCRACLVQCWEESGNPETSCPQCRERIPRRKFRTNQSLANVVEITKKLSLQGPKKAKGKESVCEKHQEPLKLFCKDDETLICEKCDKEHVDHRKVPLGKAAQDYKVLMGLRQNDLVKERDKFLVYKAEIEKEAQDLLKQTKAKTETTLEEITAMRQFLDKQEKHLLAQREELEMQIARKRDEPLVLLSQELSSLQSLIQELKEKCQQSPEELLQDVRNLLQRCEEKRTSEKPVAFLPELKWKIWQFFDLNSFLTATMKPFRDALLPGLELQKANVTLDPDTAGPWLILSEDRKSVRFIDNIFHRMFSLFTQSEIRQHVRDEDQLDNPERFRPQAYVLGRERFTSGRHFWEVVVEGEGDWAVGVARKSVWRKGPVCIGPEEGIWAVGRWGGRYRASGLPSNTDFPLSKKTKRVQVCLNCASNQVIFYDADTRNQIYVLSDVQFSVQIVLPFFYAEEEVHLRISP